MQGTMAQIVALTIHGNAFLRGIGSAETTGFFPANSTFRFCEYVQFMDLKGEGSTRKELSYASEPLAWMQRLKEEGVVAFYLRYVPSAGQKVGERTVPDYQLVGFVGGGGRWLIEAAKPTSSDYWEDRWQVGDRTRQDQKIWQVTYGRIATNQQLSPFEAPNVEELKSRLGKQLTDIAAFARQQNLDNFAQCFERGLDCLTSFDCSAKVYHKDIAPPGMLPPSGVQLLNAVQAGWVFGAMGSWNDLGFEGESQQRYEELSTELYSLFVRGIAAATNTSASSAPTKQRAWWQRWT